jgi:hypothetical protein
MSGLKSGRDQGKHGERNMPDSNERRFDLNVEKILEGWEICHAAREIIANAIDEQVLTGTRNVDISKDRKGVWHIRDFGRGLKYEHLTQNENQEKLKNPTKVIGKFGVGLKDALATLSRRKVDVLIRSKYGDVSLERTPKHGFPDVVTLHALVKGASDPGLVGTDFGLSGVSDADISAAKNFFLKFSNQAVLDETSYGQILGTGTGCKSRIYVTGMLVAEEENFAFSYNITSLTATMRKALNRERTNVGRTAYSDRVKQMLLASKAEPVAEALAEDLQKIEKGTNRDEVKWTDVAVHACQILNASKRAVFVTASDLTMFRDAIDHAENDGFKIVTVPENIRNSLRGITDLNGNPVRDLGVFQSEYAQSFEFKFVRPEKLSKPEQKVFALREKIASLTGGIPKKVKQIKISETMRPDIMSGYTPQGLWDEATNSIIILRKQLASVEEFAGTLLHEIAHAKTGYADVSRDFENALTEMLGRVAASQLS